jgi:hypothetical protein
MATSTTAKKPATKPAAKKTTAAASSKVTAKKVTAKTTTTKTATVKKPAAKPVAVAAEKKPAAKAKAAPAKVNLAPSPEQRYRMVQDAAYFIAEKNGFKAGSMDYWIAAEIEIEALLSGKDKK